MLLSGYTALDGGGCGPGAMRPRPADLGGTPRPEQHLDQVDPRAGEPGLARQRAGRPHPAAQGAEAQAVAGPEPAGAARGLDLADHQRLAVREREVDLGTGGAQPAREAAQAARPQEALGDALAGQAELAVGRREARRREGRREAEGEPAQPAGAGPQEAEPASLDSLASAPSGSSVSTLWIAARLKRMRTPSATCSVTTSSLTMATEP